MTERPSNRVEQKLEEALQERYGRLSASARGVALDALQRRITRRRHRSALVAATAVVILAAGGGVAAAQISRSGGTPANGLRETTTNPTPTSTSGTSPTPAVAIGTGYAHSEQFCAKKPLTGTITYVVHSDKTATLQLRLQDLSVRNKLVGVEWQQKRTEGGSHGTYGYTIASFRSSADGRSQQSTLRFFRAPYARGLGIVLDTGPHARTIGTLARC